MQKEKISLFEFESRQETINFLISYLQEIEYPKEVVFEICDATAPLFIVGEDTKSKKPKHMVLRSFLRKNIYYAIHNDNLLLFKSAVLVTLLFFTSENIKTFAPSLISSLVLLVYTFKKKAIEIDCEQAIVLKALKSQRGGISFNEVCNLCIHLLRNCTFQKNWN